MHANCMYEAVCLLSGLYSIFKLSSLPLTKCRSGAPVELSTDYDGVMSMS